MKRICCAALAMPFAAILLAGTTADAAPTPTPEPVVGDLPKATPQAIADFRKQADALYRMKERAFAHEDADTIVDRFYARDAVSFGPEGKPTFGRDSFRQDYRKVVKIANVKVEPITTHVGADAAWEWANFRAFPRDPKQKPFTFIMLFVWAKAKGHWYCGGDAYTLGEFPKMR